MPAAASVANLANEEWTITNAAHDVVTVDLWLDVALRRHAADLAERTGQLVPVRYQLDGMDIDDDVCAVRSVLDWLREAYRVAKTYDVTTRPERYALLQQLADSRVMPSEMAVMVGVDVSIAERFAGADDEARIARTILHRLSNT
jgi:integrase